MLRVLRDRSFVSICSFLDSISCNNDNDVKHSLLYLWTIKKEKLNKKRERERERMMQICTVEYTVSTYSYIIRMKERERERKEWKRKTITREDILKVPKGTEIFACACIWIVWNNIIRAKNNSFASSISRSRYLIIIVVNTK